MLGLGLLIPFAGTTLGAAMVFLMKNKINEKLEKLLLGFASGVMIAASVWSLLIPSIEMAEGYKLKFLPAAVGFLLGIVFLLVLDSVIPHLHIDKTQEGIKTSKLKKTTMMVLAVTLHNIPEGMAVGVTLAAALKSNSGITTAAAAALSIGIAFRTSPRARLYQCRSKARARRKARRFCSARSQARWSPCSV